MVATLRAEDSDPYTLDPTRSSAFHTTNDNDFPAATAVLTLSSPNDDDTTTGVTEVDEGGTVTATVTIRTTGDETPHGRAGGLYLTTAAVSAGASDFTALLGEGGSGFLNFPRSDETRVRDPDNDGNEDDSYWQVIDSLEIATADDSVREPSGETFTVTMVRLTAGAFPTSPNIVLSSPTSRTISINPSDLGADADLSGLTLSAGTLAPGFAGGTTSYTADVGYGNTRITVTPALADANSTIAWLDEDDMTLADAAGIRGFQVDLAVGDTTFKIEVTAEDGTTTKTYTVTVTRAVAVAWIQVVSTTITEGDQAELRFLRDAPVDTTTLRYRLSQTGGAVDSANVGNKELDIGPGATSARVQIPTVEDDVWEATSTFTAELLADASYSTTDSDMRPDRVEIAIEDDDFPDADAWLALSTTSASENDEQAGQNGDTITATITVRTERPELPHEGAGRLQFSIGADSDADTLDASGADYTISGSRTPTFAQADFVRVDGDGNPDDNGDHYQATESINIKINNDAVKEQAEVFVVSMARVTSGVQTDSRITLDAARSSQDVTIALSDLSTDPSLATLGLNAAGANRGAFTPAFVPDTTTYAVTVPFQYPQITVAPTPTDGPLASYEVLDSSDTALDDDAVTSGAQVDLPLASAAVVKVKVTAEDLVTTRVYTLRITRQLPVLSISMPAGELDEGESTAATVSRVGATQDETTVTVEVTDSSSVAAAGQTGTRTATIAAGGDSTTITVTTEDDTDWDAHATIGVELVENAANYSISGTATVSRRVLDDDFPAAQARLEIDVSGLHEGNVINEGDAVFATLIIETNAKHEPHEAAGGLVLSTSDGPVPDGADPRDAEARGRTSLFQGDYVTVDNLRSGFGRSDFELDEDAQIYRASQERRIITRNDQSAEYNEYFTVSMAASMLDANVSIPGGAGEPVSVSELIQILRSDLADDTGLQSLTSSSGELDQSTEQVFTAAVGFGHPQPTITAELKNTGQQQLAMLSSLGAKPGTDAGDNDDDVALTDANDGIAGFQVDLEVLTAKTIYVRVTAQDDSFAYYTLTLTRQEPVVSIANTSTAEVGEGAPLTFTVSLDGLAEAAGGRVVNIGLTQLGVDSDTAGSVLPSGADTNPTVTVPMGQMSARLAVTTEDDDAWDEHAYVTATVASGSDYTITDDAAMSAVTRRVNDDDFPDAEVALSVPDEVSEPAATRDGNRTGTSSATFQVTILTDRGEEPREAAGGIQLTTTDGTASSPADYTALTASQGLLRFERRDFVEVDHDDNPGTPDRWRAPPDGGDPDRARQ